MKKVKLISLLCLTALSNLVLSQKTTIDLNIFSITQLQEDFNYWRHRIESKHPLVYLYTPKNQVDRCFDSLYQEIKYPMTELAFIKLLTPIAALIQDGHTYVIPSKTALDSLRSSEYLLPLEVKCIDDRLYVTQDLSTSAVPLTGLEITAINTTTTKDILSLLLSNLGRDGNNYQHAYAAINESFRFHFHTFFGFDTTYVIHYRTHNNIDRTCTIPGRNLDSIKKEKSIRYPSNEQSSASGLKLNILDSIQTAILGIKTFSPATTNKKFRAEISNYFETIRKANTLNLILDIRGNSGGNPNHVKFILQHVFDEPFEQARTCRVVKNRHEEELLTRTRKQWYPWYGIGKFKPRKNNFTGNVYALIDEGTYSAGVIFSSVLRKYNRAVFVGDETGGNPIIMAGYLIKTSWELPNTKIQFGSGTLCTIYDDLGLNRGRGLIPDHMINTKPEDLVSFKDQCFDYTLQLIRDKR
ncbi:MAG: hypothetical protein IPP25_18325 [Saprospiraceae bacterium]|nr:hypothetical protein [Candidatus Opimibacter skivensis]